MGPKPVLSEDIEKLDKTFGNLLSPGKLSHQFHTMNGGENISVAAYGCRLEEHLAYISSSCMLSQRDKAEMLRNRFLMEYHVTK